MSVWSDPDLTALFRARTPLIDVRAPVEYAQGSVPFSVNLPLLTNDERHEIGIAYKTQGQAAAIELGHQLVSGPVRSARVQQWVDYLKSHPSAQVMCFRGGLRSQISSQWITEAGIPRTPVSGGYKRMRRFFLSWLTEAPLPPTLRLGGLTGSGKTTLLRTLPGHLDLEELAGHRGSAFGYQGPQPSQVRFENELALGLLTHQGTLIVEDESPVIGERRLPQRFFAHLRSANLVILETPIDQRARTIFEDYVRNRSAEFFLVATKRLSRRLGGALSKHILETITHAFTQPMTYESHGPWIILLLENYYDPSYRRDLERQKEKIVFSGTCDAVKKWLAT